MECENCKHVEHNHEHHHKHGEHEESSKLNKILYIIGIIILLISLIPQLSKYKAFLVFCAILLTGYKMILEGIKNIFHFNFEEESLMTIAVIAAFILGEHVEAAMVVILFRLGEFLEDKAVDKSNSNIEEIVKIKAETANRVKDNEEIEIVDVEQIQVGDIILIKPGEKVPVDSVILKGNSTVDTAAITGESVPVEVGVEQEILSGSVNLTGALTCKVIKDAKNSTASQIVDLVYQATNNKGATEKFITKFSKIYTPTVILIAIAIAILPATFGILDYRTWILRALTFLVASCPCSLVISVPLAFFSCVGAISKKGMIIKGTKHIENLSKATVVAFDKTGTLTTGKMKIDKLETFNGFSMEKLVEYIYNLENLSNHPIGSAIKSYAMENNIEINKLEIVDYTEIAGHGLYGKIENAEILFGNEKLLRKYEIDYKCENKSAIYMAVNKEVVGFVTLKEDIREEALNIENELKTVGIKETVMLTGDNEISAKKIADALKIDKFKAGLLPQDKTNEIKQLKNNREVVIFVGDGINDSPVLATSDFGIAMGAGSQISSITADSILISNNISTLPNIINTAKKSMNIIKFNIVFSLIVKAVVLVLGAAGIAPIWSAILADTGVTLLTVLNSIRIFRI